MKWRFSNVIVGYRNGKNKYLENERRNTDVNKRMMNTYLYFEDNDDRCSANTEHMRALIVSIFKDNEKCKT